MICHRSTTVDDTMPCQFATAGAQGQRFAALIVGTCKEIS